MPKKVRMVTKETEPELKAQYVQLRGVSISRLKCSKKLKVSRKTLMKWEDEHKDEIESRQRLHQEELLGNLGVAKNDRVKAYGQLYDRISKELATRDVSEISTIQLIEWHEKLLESVRREMGSNKGAKTEDEKAGNLAQIWLQINTDDKASVKVAQVELPKNT